MCLDTKDKKKKTGIKFGWKLFLSDDERKGILHTPWQSFRLFGWGKTEVEEYPTVRIFTSHHINTPFSYPRGFHFFISRRQAIAYARAKSGRYLVAKCAVKKVHTTGTQKFGRYPSGKARILDVGVCHVITPIKRSIAGGIL